MAKGGTNEQRLAAAKATSGGMREKLTAARDFDPEAEEKKKAEAEAEAEKAAAEKAAAEKTAWNTATQPIKSYLGVA